MAEGMHLTAIGDGVVLLEPGEGLDPGAPDSHLVTVLEYLRYHQATHLIYDLENVPVIDSLYYEWLRRLGATSKLYGVEMVVANIQPPAAYALAIQLDDAPPFRCAGDVDRARDQVRSAVPDRPPDAKDGSESEESDSIGGDQVASSE